MSLRILFAFAILLFFSCENDEQQRITVEDTSQYQLLEKVEMKDSKLVFNNRITETEQVNAITFDGMLQGAGVAVLDIDNDGLQDIYFASNQEGDQLFRNTGNFKFENITDQAGIKNINWSTGVAVVDINNDGYDDIYVCKFLYDNPDKLRNVFYINNGDGTFTDKAAELGLNDPGYGIMANFFDYDRDGDLDVYIANQPPNSLQMKSALKGKINYAFTDKLYRNDGMKFTDVTIPAGVQNYSYSLSATTMDYNQDGWPDIYIACDYDEADFMYKNNGDGTFTNVANEALKHMSNFSMGVDIADINNDGHLDIYVADMVAEDNFRQKTNMSGMNPARFFALANAGHHYQYMFNALQLNNGDNSFSEIAQLSGVSNTDWSWTPLFMDIDNDGYKDLMVTNGLVKDMRNKDFEIWRKEFFARKLEEASKTEGKNMYVNPMEISNRAPSFKVSNYIYRNNANLEFEKYNAAWGFDEPSWSQGAAYADFDNDGDLDLVINNMNMNASIYRNTSNENGINNYIAITLEGNASNLDGINAMITVTAGDISQVYEYTPYRGYMSTSEKIAHFGLADNNKVDRIEVVWSDNKMTVAENIKANQEIVLKYADASQTKKREPRQKGVFQEISNHNFAHKQNEFDDYKREVLLPYRMSTLGPVLASGDIDNDGTEEVYFGASVGSIGKIIKINDQGELISLPNKFLERDRDYEDGGARFFDANGDGNLDLYISSGGNEYEEKSIHYRDRLYLGDGTGNFSYANSLPDIRISTSIVIDMDYDGDGDRDLFVGGRQKPGFYGRTVNSYILENNNGTFSDVSEVKAPFLSEFGMVTTAEYKDINGDDKGELVIAGEWMNIHVIEIKDGAFYDKTAEYGLDKSKGWWNDIAIADIDGDGDSDIIAGNLGHNIKYKASPEAPFKLYVDDFDNNGTNDVYLGYYENGKCYPVRGRQCSSEQMPFIKKKFESYEEFGLATIDKVLEEKISDETAIQEAYTFSNSVFINDGQGRFSQVVLPSEAQISPVNSIVIDDFDKNGKPEIFVAGNMYEREVETTRSDAGTGALISFIDSASIDVKRTLATGIKADLDVRDATVIQAGNSKYLFVANNDDRLQVWKY